MRAVAIIDTEKLDVEALAKRLAEISQVTRWDDMSFSERWTWKNRVQDLISEMAMQ